MSSDEWLSSLAGVAVVRTHRSNRLSGISIEVIIPIRNMADQLYGCVPPLLPQCRGADVVTVVDDASTDGTAEAAREIGAHVLSLSSSVGPYHARELAARASTADVLLFVDGRCRPKPGLLESHRSMQSRSGVALSCTSIRTLGGPTVAAKVAAGQQPFSLDSYIGVRGRLDYYPTANLGINASAFREVGGFRAMRSGADADICWRIQESALGALAVDERELMEWEPRSSLRDLGSQWYRYGQSAAYLEWLYASDASPIIGKWDSLADMVRQRLRRMVATPPAENAAALFINLVYLTGYWRGKRARGTFVSPRPIAPAVNSTVTGAELP